MAKQPAKKKSDVIDIIGVDIFRKTVMDLNIADAVNACSASKSVRTICDNNFWRKYLETNYSITYLPPDYSWSGLARILSIYLNTPTLFGLSKPELVKEILDAAVYDMEVNRYNELKGDIEGDVLDEEELVETDQGFTVKFEYLFYLFDLGMVAVVYRVLEDEFFPEKVLRIKVYRISKLKNGLEIIDTEIPQDILGQQIEDTEGGLEASLVRVLGEEYETYPFTLDSNITREGKSFAELD